MLARRFNDGAAAAAADPGPITSADLGPTNKVWQIPLVGLPDNIADPWGINTTVNGKTSPYIIVVSDTTPAAVSGSTEIQPGLLTIGGNNIGTNVLELGSNSQEKIILGSNSHINISTSSDSIGKISTPTVPFGLNLGHNENWNGSLVLGGDYDANRVTSGVWNLVNESANGNSTFLTSGQQSLSTVTLKFKSTNSSTEAVETYNAIIDLNSDAIALPTNAGIGLCEAGFSIVLKTISGQTKNAENVTIAIPADLTSPSGRCNIDNDNSSITLGRPFFQAAYVYVDTKGELWFNPAHQTNLPPNPSPFNSTQTLHTSAAALGSGSSSSSWNQHTQDIVLGTIGGVIGVIVILSSILCVLHQRRNKKTQQRHAQQEIDKLQIKVLRDKIEEDTISLDKPSRLPPPTPVRPVEPVSVFESDDEGGPTVLKRTKTFLKSFKGSGRRRGDAEKNEGFDKRVIVQAGRVSPRNSRSDGFEDTAWGHDHVIPRGIGVAVTDYRT